MTSESLVAAGENFDKSDGPIDVLCMATATKACDWKPMKLKRRALLDGDVLFDVVYSGVCHSDLSISAGHLDGVIKCNYPCVPGHEIAGIVTAVGKKVTKFKVGERIGVGCMVDSCKKCRSCKAGEEQNCSSQVATYCGVDKSGRAQTFPPKQQTLGGYSDKMVVHEDFGIRIPESYPLEMAGPIMCAGITMYDPMKKSGVTQGTRVGIVGLGGLGQMGIKIAKALGAQVTVISRSAKKAEIAKNMGADNFVASEDQNDMVTNAKSLDVIINTIPVYHDYVAYNRLLRKGGKHFILGLHKGFAAALAVDLITCHLSPLKSSMIGGIRNTQEIMDICAEKKIYPTIKIVPVHELNDVYGKLGANDDATRYVLDIKGSLNEGTAAKCTAPPPKLEDAPGQIAVGAVVGETLKLLFTGRAF